MTIGSLDGAALRHHTGAAVRTGAPLRVPSHAVLCWLALGILFQWLVSRGLISADGLSVVAFAANVSAIEFVEVVLIGSLLASYSARHEIGMMEAAAHLALLAYILLLARNPLTAAAILAFVALIRFSWVDEHRPASICLSVFVMQYNTLIAQPFMAPGWRWAELDAYLLRGLLELSGYPVIGSGSIVYNPAQEFGIDVLRGCASIEPLRIVLAAFVIVVLALRRRIVASDLAIAGVLAIAVVCANLMRLAPSALSRAGYQYWHGGDGASLFAALYALLAIGAGYAAVRYAPEVVERR